MSEQTAAATARRGRPAKSKGVEKIEADAKGQGFIPGAEPMVVKELVDFGIKHEETKLKHRQLTDKLEEENSIGVELYRKHKQYFEEDGKGNFVYEAAGIRIVIGKPGDLKVKTKAVPTPDQG